MSNLDHRGFEIPDPTPVSIPAHMRHIERDHIRDIIRQELSRHAENVGFESWEDADDFDVGDDYDPSSPYEEEFDPQTGESLWSRSVDSGFQSGPAGSGHDPAPTEANSEVENTPPEPAVTTV